MSKANVRDEVSSTGPRPKGSGSDLWQVSEYVERPAQRVPVIHDVDVVVAGGGIAGIIAALAAARHGAKTLVVEAFGTLGGDIGPGMFTPVQLCIKPKYYPDAFPDGLGGIPAEFNHQVVDGQHRLVGESYFHDIQMLQAVAVEMLNEAGVEILLSSVVCGAIKDGDCVRGVFVENKSGTLAIRSKVVIDCTGTADVADRAGAAVIEVPEDPGIGSFLAIANIDWDAYQRALTERGELSKDDQQWLEQNGTGYFYDDRYMPWVRHAVEAGEFKMIETVDDFATIEILMRMPDGEPRVARCRTRVNGRFSPGDGLALSRIQETLAVYIHDYINFFRKHVPGFQQASLHIASPFLHARGGKSIESQYVIDYDRDVKRSARFDDVVFVYYDDKAYFEGGCDIPYRMMVPSELNGLLAAGRSAIRRGPNIRGRCYVQLMGQAAGVAAALAVKHNVEPRDVDVKELQKILHSLGAQMGSDERLRELGII